MKRVFVSFSHKQADWVLGDLCPVLRASGVEVLSDDSFVAGRGVVGQMDSMQDGADASIVVLSPSYVDSRYCMHELDRAVARDPELRDGRVVPVIRESVALPPALARAEPLYVDLRDDADAGTWQRLVGACGGDLGCSAPSWLDARAALVDFLSRDVSVNLVVREAAGNAAGRRPRWRPLIADVRRRLGPARALGEVDLESGATSSRRGLLEELLRAAGAPRQLPKGRNEDLVTFTRQVRQLEAPACVALLHFDRAAATQRDYGEDLFATLRDLIGNERKLVLLLQSRRRWSRQWSRWRSLRWYHHWPRLWCC